MTLTPLPPNRLGPSIRRANRPDRLMHGRAWQLTACLALAASLVAPALANDPPPAPAAKTAAADRKAATPAAATKNVTEEVREAVESGASPQKRLTLVVNGKEKKLITMPANEGAPPPKPTGGGHSSPPAARPVDPPSHAPAPAAAMTVAAAPAHRFVSAANPVDSRQYIRAKAAALAGHGAEAGGKTGPTTAHEGEAHWSYEGDTGPQAWGQLKPAFNVCALGKRQSPINIEESATLQGPAEPLQFNYQPSSGTVVNNGHTIQVDMVGDNSVTVRGSNFKLVQFHFHHPSEERVNYKGFAMVVHLVHKNTEGQLAVVAVLLERGAANALIEKVWTHMPLDSGDRVRLPAGLIDITELLPKDQRYFQFMGSLTTPPCSEGVLWMVLKQPTTASQSQIRLFSQLFPNNARPVQPVNGRAVRDAQ